MRILVCSDGESLDSPMADDFGHAPFFLLVESDTLDYRVVVNEFKDSEQGAGMAVARAIAGLGCVDAVLVDGIGMHGIQVLKDAGIDVSPDEDGIVEDCIRDYLRRRERKERFEKEAAERTAGKEWGGEPDPRNPTLFILYDPIIIEDDGFQYD